MARLPRLAIAGEAHHIVQRSADGQPVFVDDDDRRLYLAALARAARASGVALHAYVLMPDHVHLVATPATRQGLGDMMQRTGRGYVAAYNKRHSRSGALWEGRFRATVLDPDRFLLECLSHVELNPVRHGLVERPQDWAWSSAAHHLGVRTEALITEPVAYWRLGNTPFERENAYRALLAAPLAESRVQALRDATRKGWALGSPEFVRRIATLSERRVLPGKRGRRAVGAPDDSVPNIFPASVQRLNK